MKRTLVASAITLLCASPVLAQTQGANQPDTLQNQQTERQQTGASAQDAQLRTTFINASGQPAGGSVGALLDETEKRSNS